MKMLNDLHGRITAFASGLKCAAPPGRTACEASFSKRLIGGRVSARLLAGEEGSAILEFAFLLPIMLMVAMGIMSFGSAMVNKSALNNSVLQGAQVLTTSRSVTNFDPCKAVFSAITGAAPSLNPASITLTLTLNNNPSIVNTGATANTCESDNTELAPNTPVTILAQYPCNVGVYGVTIAPGCTLSAQVTEDEN
jgi:Flp pilus assembly protein TadG